MTHKEKWEAIYARMDDILAKKYLVRRIPESGDYRPDNFEPSTCHRLGRGVSVAVPRDGFSTNVVFGGPVRAMAQVRQGGYAETTYRVEMLPREQADAILAEWDALCPEDFESFAEYSDQYAERAGVYRRAKALGLR